jgi:uncharacterized protein YdaU (DUF1376 family)
MHYYQFHIGDYKSHTHHLSIIEDLAFRRLLDFYYLHEQPIKQRDIARQIGMREHEQEVLTVLDEFFISTEGGYINPRADKEIAKFKEFAEAGKRGAAKRWSKEGQTTPNGEAISPPNATPIATNNHKPITNNHIEETTSLVVSPSEKTPSAPIAEIVDLYNSRLPMLPRVTVVSDSRKRLVAARWRDVVSADKLDRKRGLEFFDWFFVHVGKSKFLTGRSKDWKANFEFLFTASKFPRIVEGAYHQEQT